MIYGDYREALRQLRQDDWVSSLGGLGGRNDRGRANAIRFRDCLMLDDATLSAAYRDLWLVRRLIDMPVDDALRRGWGLPEDVETPRFDALNTATHSEGAFERACKMARLKGGAGLYIGYKETGGPEALLEPAREGAEVAFLEVFDRFQLQGEQRANAPADVDRPDYDQPQVWQVIGNRRSGLRFHTSRMIRFPGAPRADTFTVTSQDRDWDDSVLQASWPDVMRYGVFWQTVGHLLQLASIGVLKIDGLIQLLSSKRKDDAEARIDLLNQMVGNTRMMMLDAKMNEDYHREAVSFADMPALLQEMAIATAGALGMPVTKLFRRAPAGMNATGESDIRLWYDDVEAYRCRVIEPRLEKTFLATEQQEIEVEFEPMWSPTEKETADVRKTNIDATERLWSMGVVSDAEIRAAMIAGDLVELTVSGPPTAEPTRAVTVIQTLAPGENPSAPEDPKAADDPTPAPRPSPFTAKKDGLRQDGMPMPSPGQSEKDFIAAFMKNSQMMADYPDEKQRLAVAYAQLKKRD